MLLNAVPNILAAGIILTVAWFVARFVSGVLDGLPERMGIASILPERSKPAPFVGRAVVLFLMLFVPVEAASRLGFTQFADIVETFILFGSQVLLGVTIIRIGFWLSNLAHAAIQRVGGANAGVLAGVARFAIVGVALAMGFNAMEIADQVVNVAFGPTLGAVAVAIALMFGLGGRDAAGRQTEHSFRKLHGESNRAGRPVRAPLVPSRHGGRAERRIAHALDRPRSTASSIAGMSSTAASYPRRSTSFMCLVSNEP